jgi:hypothetical protein
MGLALQIIVGMEYPEVGAYQKRVGLMRLLGELYNYRVVDSRWGSFLSTARSSL